jgi:hypothetical protein
VFHISDFRDTFFIADLSTIDMNEIADPKSESAEPAEMQLPIGQSP